MFNTVDIIYGTRDLSRLLFKFQYEMWKKDDIGLHIILENADGGWTGPTGYIPKILEGIIEFVSRPQTWLENAEWNHLEDY